MKVLGIVALLAACGGGAAPLATTSTSAPQPAAEEDWRGQLAQLAGGTCQWIGGSTLVYCVYPGEDNTRAIIGWEPHNRRYVYWMVAPDGTVRVFAGTAGNDAWVFTDPDARITLSRDTAGWSVRAERLDGGGVVFASLIETSQPTPATDVPPGSGAPNEDWRSPLEQLSARWSFSGTANGEPVTFNETCRWVTGSTYVLCKVDGARGFTMLGYELHNRRFVHYAFPKQKPPHVQAGTVTKGSWRVSDDTERAQLLRESPIKYAFKLERLGADGQWSVAVDGAYTTDPAAQDTAP